MLDARLEGCGAHRQIAAAGRTEPVDGIEVEIVEHRLGGLLPFRLEEDALPQRAALSRPVEADHGEAEFGERQQEGVELLDEGIVAAVEDEGADLLALRLQAEAGKCPPG